MLIEHRDQLVVFRLARDRVGDRVQFLAIAELDRALQPHPAKFAARPGDREQRGLVAPPGHRDRAEAIAFAQHNREQRNGEIGPDHEHPRGVAHQAGLLDVRPDHDPGGIAERQQGNVVGLAQLHEPCGLVRCVAIDRAAQMRRIVGDDPHRSTLDPGQRDDHRQSEAAAQLEDRVLVGQRGDHRADIVDPETIFGDEVTQTALVGASPVGERPLEV